MARLAEAMKPENLSRNSGLALALGLSLVMLVAVPLLVSAIGLFLYAAGSAAALSAVLHHIINLLAAVMSMLEVFMQGAQDVLSNSQAPALLMALIPISMIRALPGPTAIWARWKVYSYMKFEGRQEEVTGPPPVRATTRS